MFCRNTNWIQDTRMEVFPFSSYPNEFVIMQDTKRQATRLL